MATISQLVELLLFEAPLELKGDMSGDPRDIDSRRLGILALDGQVLMSTRTSHLKVLMG